MREPGSFFFRRQFHTARLLRAGHDDYVINAEALAYLRQRALAGPVIARLAEHPDQAFADQAAWTAHLDRLGQVCGRPYLFRRRPRHIQVAARFALSARNRSRLIAIA
jgi:hypothetical protein